MKLARLIEESQDRRLELHRRYLNPAFVRVLELIGFDRDYVRGQGAYLEDREGNRYLDLLSGYGVFQLGRSHPAVKRALAEALELDRPNLVQMDCPLLAGLLAERLAERARASFPEMGEVAVFFTNSGAESVEAALKFARAATGRPRFLYLEGAFHGLTLGALSLNGSAHFREGFEPLLSSTAVPLNDLAALERELERGDVAAFLVEPVQGKTVRLPEPDYLPEAQRLCRAHGALFVLDEVQTGLGRTGRFFAGEHWGLSPDLVAVSKALSGGYVPVGALLARRAHHRKVFSTLERSVVHSNTFGMNALAMTAGLATLEVLESEGLIENAARRGERLLAGLGALAQRYELLHEVRGLGLLIGLEFGPPRALKLRSGWTLLEKAQPGMFAQTVVMALMQEHRLLTQVSGHRVNIVKLLPPLILSDEEVERIVSAFDAVLAQAHRFPGGLWSQGLDLVKRALGR